MLGYGSLSVCMRFAKFKHISTQFKVVNKFKSIKVTTVNNHKKNALKFPKGLFVWLSCMIAQAYEKKNLFKFAEVLLHECGIFRISHLK